ncbi:hypothetical protein [Raoultibacter massiliensis]|uniref:hypothetical protein n=1 Tax=Raoultibacter massiliensis TaxID=1852371 RepID=UPI003A949D7D
MDLSSEKIEEVRAALADYKNTGNPDLLSKLRGYLFEYKDYDGDDPVILALKQAFHF